MQLLHAVDAALVEGIGSCVARIGIRIVVAQAFHQVEAETVHLIFLKPELQHIAPLLAHQRIALVPVVQHAVGMRRVQVEEGILARFVQLVPRMAAVGLVEHHVKDDGDPQLMAAVDETLVVGRCAVCLVGGHIEVGVVAPGDVAVELVDRQQLNGVDAEIFQITEPVVRLVDSTVALGLTLRAGEVAQQHLIDHKVLLIRGGKALALPVIVQHRVGVISQEGIVRHLALRIFRKSGIYGS